MPRAVIVASMMVTWGGTFIIEHNEFWETVRETANTAHLTLGEGKDNGKGSRGTRRAFH